MALVEKRFVHIMTKMASCKSFICHCIQIFVVLFMIVFMT